MVWYGNMKKHIITIGGLPGSGKSTIKRILADMLDYQTFSTGDFVRDMAYERNLSLEEFNELIRHDKTLDLLIDDRLKHIEAEEDNFIIDSHLAFHFVPSGFSVFLTISPEVSAHRIFHDAHSPTRIKSGDTMETYEEAYARTQKRIQNHIERYTALYGINPYRETQYALVINTETHTPTHIAHMIADTYQNWLLE
jgi:cytidylate kinase